MERRLLGKTGMNVSVLGFGGAEIGYENAGQDEVDRILGTALDSGVNVLDTAECYEDSEEKIGRAAGHRRNEYFLFTKCGHAAGIPMPEWSPELLRASIDRSLERLRTSYVDLLQLHSCSAEVLAKGDVIGVLQEARDAGKTRFIGYSGDSEDALAAVRTGVFDTLQTSVNLLDQESIDLTVPEAVERSMGVIAKRPLANVVWRYEERPENTYYHEYWDRMKQIDYLFLRCGSVGESVATALRFTLSVPGVAVAIAGTKSEQRFRENLEMAKRPTLPADQFEFMRGIWRDRAQPGWTGQV